MTSRTLATTTGTEHCTTTNPDRDGARGIRAECTCGWSSTLIFGLDAEDLATWHRISVGETIDNPYLRAFLAPIDDAEIVALGFGDAATSTSVREMLSEMLAGRGRRDRLVAEYAWAIPTELVIRKLAELSPICDLGCGTGYWAKLLTEVGARVLAVDAFPPLEGDNHWHRKESGLSRQIASIQHHVDIVKGDAATFDVPADHALMLCWPPYSCDMAAVALARYQGSSVIYIGEGDDGCTGDDAFHKALYSQWDEVACYMIPQWDGIHDSVYVYARKTEAT